MDERLLRQQRAVIRALIVRILAALAKDYSGPNRKFIENASAELIAMENVIKAIEYAIESQAVNTECSEGIAILEALDSLQKVREL